MARTKKGEATESLPLVDEQVATTEAVAEVSQPDVLLPSEDDQGGRVVLRPRDEVTAEIEAAAWDEQTLFQIICDVVEPFRPELGWTYAQHLEFSDALPELLEKAVGMDLDVRPLQESLAAQVAGLEAQASHYHDTARGFEAKARAREDVLSILDNALLSVVQQNGSEFGKAGNKRLTLGGTDYKTASSQSLVVNQTKRDEVELDHPEWLEEPKEPGISTSKVKAALKRLAENEQREAIRKYGFVINTKWRLDYK